MDWTNSGRYELNWLLEAVEFKIFPNNITQKTIAMLESYCSAKDRFGLWASFIKSHGFRTIAEIGVYRGEFSAKILAGAPSIEKYIMIDPWRAIPDWNKPANTDDKTFENFYLETLRETDFAAQKRQVLRGKTTEVIGQIPDQSLDYVYIDGDHTLKGITIDLISVWPKVKDGGWITGDDFCNSIWQHPDSFEPTLIFPFAIYFAEAMGVTICALPYNQFAMQKMASGFRFMDLTGTYLDTSIQRHVVPRP